MVRTAVAAVAAICLLGFANPAKADFIDIKDLPEVRPQVQQANEFLRSLGQGNERSGAVEVLGFDSKTGEAKIRVSVRSRHVVGRIGLIKYTVVAYDYTVRGEVTMNFRTGRITGVVDLGRGIRINVGSMANILGKSLR